MNAPEHTRLEKPGTLIGKRLPRVDAREKVTGDARYAADFSFPGMLWVKILRSPHAHARIVSIDTSEALKLKGVKGVLTGKDFNGWTWGWMPKTREEAPLAVEKVRFYGEAVAGVCAVDEATAEEACALIRVEYEELPGVFSIEEAIAEGAPLLHDDRPGNLSWEFHMDFGDVEAGFREADLVREHKFETGRVVTGFLEPPAAVAQWTEEGITVWSAKQSPYFHYRHLAACFNLPLSKIRVIQPFIGGGFGGTKNDSVAADFCAVLFSKRLGKPVKYQYSMEEVFTTCRRRHNFTVVAKMGMKKDGTITALQNTAYAEGGAYTVIGPLTLYLSGAYTTLPYRIPSFKYDAHRVFTNHPSGAAMRGHGATHTRFAAEILMEMMAEELGIDPLAVRLKNAVIAPHTTVNGVHVKTCGIKQALETVGDSPAWRNRNQHSKERGNIAHGVGIAGATFGGGARQRGHQSCGAIVRLCEDGTLNYLTGATDCGQGSDTVLVQIVAEELGLALDDVTIRRVDTAVTPCDPGSYGSRVTILAGQAAQKAAREVRRQLAQHVAGIWDVPEAGIEFAAGRVYSTDRPELSMPFRKLAQAACYSESGRVIVGSGYSESELGEHDFEKGWGNSDVSYSFTAQLTEVDVDMETGIVKATDFYIAHDCGRPLHPVNVESQVEGAAVQGLGQALYEEFKMENGRTLNPDFVDYRMPLATEAPNIRVAHIITNDPDGPHGAKEASEGAIVSAPPSIIAAIHNATGIWFTSQPVTPEKILKGLKEKRAREAQAGK
jgi:4-hydroxybenzoyl-CoA reductase alpha subunit